MNCPQCESKASSLPGGHRGIIHSTRYYQCRLCGIKLAVTGDVVRILPDEIDTTFKSKAEARRVLYESARNDREWFGELTDETIRIARVFVKKFLFKKEKRRPAQPLKPAFNIGKNSKSTRRGLQK